MGMYFVIETASGEVAVTGTENSYGSRMEAEQDIEKLSQQDGWHGLRVGTRSEVIAGFAYASCARERARDVSTNPTVIALRNGRKVAAGEWYLGMPGERRLYGAAGTHCLQSEAEAAGLL